MHDLSRRHYQERPLRALDQTELGALSRLKSISDVLAYELDEAVADLGSLADMELDQRDLDATLGRTERLSTGEDRERGRQQRNPPA